MNIITLQNWQWQTFDLEIGRVLTPACFHRLVSVYRNTVTKAGRLLNNLINSMAIKFRLIENVVNGGGVYFAYGDFIETNNNSLLTPAFYVTINDKDYDTIADARAATFSGIVAEAATRGYTGFSSSDIQDFTAGSLPSNLVPMANNAPQAAISDCPADAVTNYNVVTTLLGALTGAVNTANTKQNEIATKLNDLLAKLRTTGVIST